MTKLENGSRLMREVFETIEQARAARDSGTLVSGKRLLSEAALHDQIIQLVATEAKRKGPNSQ